ncbi:MAG: hypothetical protein GY926_19685 [bacterium]|nr:hypothetical protein [bacterium]
MPKVRDLFVEVGFSVKGAKAAEAAIGKTRKSLGNLAKQAAAAAVAIGSAFLGFGTLAVKTAGAFESLKASLKTVTGSAEAANAAFAQIKSFASTTPFDLQQVTQAFIKLKALGLDPSEENLRSFGNTASAMGKSLNDVTEAVADASTGEFERLKEFGIKAASQGDQVALTFQGITTTVGKNSKEITAFLREIGEENFAGAMEEQMGTLRGIMSNLGDNFDQFLVKVAESGPLDEFKALASEIRDVLGGDDGLAKALGKTLADAIKTVRKNLPQIIDGFKSFVNGTIALVSAAVKLVDIIGGPGGLIGVLISLKGVSIATSLAMSGMGVAGGAIGAALVAAGLIVVHFEKKVAALRATTRGLTEDLAGARLQSGEHLKTLTSDELLNLKERMKRASPETRAQIEAEINRREDLSGGGKEEQERVRTRNEVAARGFELARARAAEDPQMRRFRREAARRGRKVGSTDAAVAAAEAAFAATIEKGGNIKAARKAGFAKLRGLSGLGAPKEEEQKEKTFGELIGLGTTGTKLGAFNSRAENPVLGTTINRFDFSPTITNKFNVTQQPGESGTDFSEGVRKIVKDENDKLARQAFQHFSGAPA